MTEHDFADRYGPWALVVGAAAGLGAAYARQLAERGLSVVLADRDVDGARALADALSAAGAEVRVVACDLAEDGAAAALAAEVEGLDVGLVVCNAAVSHVGPFASQPLHTVEAQVRVNVIAPTALVHHLLDRLAARDRAGVVLMSSQSSRRGAPLVATYAATKAYLAILAESLWDELSPVGIDVLGVLPGSTRTPGWLASLPQSGTGTGGVMDPDDVVGEALDALGTGVPSIVSGEANRQADAFLDTQPRADAVAMVGAVMREMYPPERDEDPTV